MTKKQNRIRGFGRRSLSLVLATLLLLSTMAVMLTSTMLTASADISYWLLAGDFNGWSATNETYKMTKSGNNWIVTVPPNAANGFKAVAVENGQRKWNGVDTDTVSLQGNDALHWEDDYGNSGKNIKIANPPENPTGYTVYIYVDGGQNKISIVANTVPTESGSRNIGKSFDAPASVSPGNTDANGIFWAKATYYDYISDWEHGHTNWLKPIQAGTGHNWSNDEWYPFFGINSLISSQYAGKSAHPLYFGNFCYVDGAYDTSGHHYNTSNGYNTAINGLTDFQYAINNSNTKNNGAGGQGLNNYHQSYQGLMNDHLGSNGELLMAGSETEAPYFNASTLGSYVNVVNSAFPFRVTDEGAYKTYQFNSKGGQDNVYFTWAKSDDGNSAKPISVNYGGTAYSVEDGIQYFMHNEGSGKGIFPFNNGSSTNKGDKYNTNENLDYGFGVKMEVKFRVPKPNASTGVNYGSNPITFDFSGDDDLWMYITDDETGESYLVLDMGGNHKESHGSVDFCQLQSTVDHVYQGNTSSDASVTKKFADIGLNFDYNKTYTMTVFYMERGLIESNCEMTFSMYPAGNQVNVEKQVDTTAINHTSTSTALQDAVASVDEFGFLPYESGSDTDGNYALKTNTEYMHSAYGNVKTAGTGAFPLRDDQSASFLSQYTTNRYVKIKEADPNTAYLRYTTKWSVEDPFKPSRNLMNQTTSDNMTTPMQLIEKGTTDNPNRKDPNEYAQLDYTFVNTPKTGSVSITKTMNSSATSDRNKEFKAKVEISLTGANGTFRAYPLTYSVSDKTGTFETSSTGMLASGAQLKHNRTITFDNLPTNAVVKVTEQLSATEQLLYTPSYPGGNTVTVPDNSTGTIGVTNTPITPDAVTDHVEGTKLLDQTSYTGDMFRFVLIGIARFDDDPANVIGTGGTYLETTDVNNGVFEFDDLTFDREGIYRYHVYEDTSYLTTENRTFDTDFLCFNTDYLVQFTVSKGSDNKLKVDSVQYFPYSRYEDMVAGPDASGPPQEHTMTSADFTVDTVEEILIENTLQTGNITIEKENQQGQPVEGVTFKVYRVTDLMAAVIDSPSYSDSEKYDRLQRLIFSASIEDEDLEAGEGVTDEYGNATINDIPIFEDGFVKVIETSDSSGITVQRDDFTSYQRYVLLEVDGPAGYSINKTVSDGQSFTFPIEGQYDYTFSYVNHQLKNPSTAGAGMTLFKIIGLVLAGLSVMALGGYVLYSKKYAKRPAPRHLAK